MTDPEHPAALGKPLTGPAQAVTSVAFSPDGHTLAATTDDGVATVWDLNVDAAIRVVCANSAGALNSRNWADHVPIIEYTSPCL